MKDAMRNNNEMLIKAINVAQEELEAIKEYHDDMVIEKSDAILSQVIQYLKERLAGESLSNRFKCSAATSSYIFLKANPSQLATLDGDVADGIMYTLTLCVATRGDGMKNLRIDFFYDMNAKKWRNITSDSEILRMLTKYGLEIAESIIKSWDSFKSRLESSIKEDYERRIKEIKEKADWYAANLNKLDSFQI
jgi:hypothetical protein